MRKIWDIPGGVHPPENKAQSTARAIGAVALPREITLPLNQHIGAEALAVVDVGERVLKGQVVAKAQGLVSAPVHASTSGTVSAIGERPIPHASGLSARCIVIAVDGEDEWTTLAPCEDYLSLDKLTLLEKIRRAGLAGLGGAGFPTAVKLNPRADQKIHTLILNGTECEPYITADDMLMRERADEVIAGALLFAHLLDQPSTIVVGIEDNKPEAIAAMRRAARGSAVEIATFPTKYPSGGEKQLIQILTGAEVPSGGIPAQLGMVVQNVGTAVAAYRAARFGEPLISRVTTVVGESLAKQGNIEVLLGTPIDHVLAEHGFARERCAKLIIGGPMMGYAMARTDIPVVKTTNCILAPSLEESPAPSPAQPCIRCGMCAQACPASLLPQQLFWFAQAEEIDKLQAHHLFDCIECGACSYVCPSNIPLVQYYRASKGIIRQLEADKQKSDRSRQRFEFRQARIAKAEAEKEAKRQARKKAAEEAKKQLARARDTDPGTLQQKDIATLKKRLAAAEEKFAEAEQAGAPTAEALQRGVEKLRARLQTAQRQGTAANPDSEVRARAESTSESAAQLAIEKAQAKAAALAAMPEEDKARAQIAALESRLDKAKQRLAAAERENSEHITAFKASVEKLESKLREVSA